MLRLLRPFSLLLGLLLLVLGLPAASLAAADTAVEITKSIAANADDGMSGAWGFYRSLSWFEAGNPGAAYNAWFRFTGITIPKGATILAAHLEVSGEGWDSGTKLKISADKAASPTAPTSTSNHKSKVRTTASVAWTSGYADWAYHNSPEFAAVIQELVNANAYNNGAIQILVDNNGGNGEAVGGTREDGRAARLYIRYQTGAAANTPPVLAPIGNKTGTVGTLLSFTIHATDADAGSTLAYSATGMPSGATLNPTTGAFSWTPTAAGTYYVTFIVSDGTLTDSESISITVNPSGITYTLDITIVGNGSVARSPDQAQYLPGTAVTLTAQPAAGWGFAGWSGDAAGSANPTTVTLNDNKAITATFTASPAPVEFTTSIMNGADDGMSGPWGFYSGLSWYEVGNPGAAYNAWFRFTGINIPRGATILQAYLSVVETRWDSGVRLKISADRSASPTAPTSTSNHASKARTTASVAWNTGYADRAYHSSPDISAVIQELVNTINYAGGAIQVLVDNNGGAGEAVGRTLEWGQPASLYVRYQAGGTPPPANTPPVLAPIGNKTGTAGQALAFTLTATDADNDPLTFSATGLPANATLNSTTGAFYWGTPVAGTYNVAFSVSDGLATDTEAVAITIGPAPSYTLTVSIVGQGTVTKSPNQASYPAGTYVQLTAAPAAGWLWSGWSGDASGSANPYTIAVNANRSVTATFVPSTWWNGGWTSRRDLAITERSGTGLTSYQVRFDIPYVSGMRADFADLRFIDSDDTTPLSCWCESFTQGTASVWWVKVPSLPASGVKHIWLYYGNNAAVSASEIHATFLWADDFNNPAWTAGNVQQVNYGTCGQSVSGGIYTQWGVAAAEPIGEIYQGGVLMQLPASYIAEVSFRPAVKTGGAFICPLYTTVADKYECLADMQFNAVALNKVVGNAWSMLSWIPTSVGIDVGRWYRLAAVVTKEGGANRLRVRLDDTQYVDSRDSSLTFPGLAFLTYDMENSFNCSYDNFRVRAYAAVEPTAALGAEERLGAGVTVMVPVLPEKQEEAAPPPLPVQNLPARRAPPDTPAADTRLHMNDGLG